MLNVVVISLSDPQQLEICLKSIEEYTPISNGTVIIDPADQYLQAKKEIIKKTKFKTGNWRNIRPYRQGF